MRNVKKIIIFILLICLLLLSSGCRYSAYKSYYSDIEEYGEIWGLTGFRHGYEEGKYFFPSNLDNYNVIDFYCRYDEQMPLGEGIQVYLELQFPDDISVKTEIDRFTELAANCDSLFDESGLEAYATRLGDDIGIYEYALVDHHDNKIYFIYLQSLPKSEIEFSLTLLPNGYTEYGEIENVGDGETVTSSPVRPSN